MTSNVPTANLHRRREKRRRFHVRPEARGEGYFGYNFGSADAPPILRLLLGNDPPDADRRESSVLRRIARNGIWMCFGVLVFVGAMVNLWSLVLLYLSMSAWLRRFW